MTWNGQLGFQSAPADNFVVPLLDLQYNPQWEAGGFLGLPFTVAGDPQGIMGVKVYITFSLACLVAS